MLKKTVYSLWSLWPVVSGENLKNCQYSLLKFRGRNAVKSCRNAKNTSFELVRMQTM